MFSEEELRIMSAIKSYIDKFSSPYGSWYIGIASDPKQRLFNDHSVNEKSDPWIFQKCQTADSARKIEDNLINSLRTKGDTGGGDNTTKYIYGYLITNHSREE